MDTKSQSANTERVWAKGPTWLGVKSQIKAGAKGDDVGEGDDRSCPTWLQVKTQVRAGSDPDVKSVGGMGGDSDLDVVHQYRIDSTHPSLGARLR
jgi:hypothetical protein